MLLRFRDVGVRYLRWGAISYFALCVPVAVWMLPAGREHPPVAFAAPRRSVNQDTTAESRNRALHQARVWTPPAATIPLDANPPDPAGTLSGDMVRCEYVPSSPHGTTPKFDCVLPDGEVVKIKYGYTGEIYTEVAATRLLSALGFGADRMYLLPKLRCYGCVRTPFFTMWALDLIRMRERFTHTIPEDSYTDFEWVAAERHLADHEIRTADRDGWAWFELDDLDTTRGASRGERDALRLLAVMLAHWDNKPANQRLVCLSGSVGDCDRPFAYIHDVGATFGPNKLDLNAWKNAPVWADRAHCMVSMRTLPYDGGSFHDVQISESGRQLLARQLATLDEDDVASLFGAAHFDRFHRIGTANAPIDAWTTTFSAKAREITDGGPCAVQ